MIYRVPTPPPPPSPQDDERHQVGDVVNGYGFTSRGWVLGRAEAPDGTLVKFGDIHKGWKLTKDGRWVPASWWETLLDNLWIGVSF
jgi:hypothetical protein